MSCALFAPYVVNVPCTFLNTLYQVKAIVIIGISEANPLAEINWLLQNLFIYYYTYDRYFPRYPYKKCKTISLNVHFYMALYCLSTVELAWNKPIRLASVRVCYKIFLGSEALCERQYLTAVKALYYWRVFDLLKRPNLSPHSSVLFTGAPYHC